MLRMGRNRRHAKQQHTRLEATRNVDQLDTHVGFTAAPPAHSFRTGTVAGASPHSRFHFRPATRQETKEENRKNIGGASPGRPHIDVRSTHEAYMYMQ